MYKPVPSDEAKFQKNLTLLVSCSPSSFPVGQGAVSQKAAQNSFPLLNSHIHKFHMPRQMHIQRSDESLMVLLAHLSMSPHTVVVDTDEEKPTNPLTVHPCRWKVSIMMTNIQSYSQ